MNSQSENKKVKLARLAGSIYFLLLGLINLGGMLINNKTGWKDLVLLAFLSTPLVVNRKFYYSFFGALATIFWVYMLYAVFHEHTLYVRGVNEHNNPDLSPAAAFGIGYVFTAFSTGVSLMILYAGIKMPAKTGKNEDK